MLLKAFQKEKKKKHTKTLDLKLKKCVGLICFNHEHWYHLNKLTQT